MSHVIMHHSAHHSTHHDVTNHFITLRNYKDPLAALVYLQRHHARAQTYKIKISMANKYAATGHPNEPGTKGKIRYRVKKAIEKNNKIFIGKTCAKDGLKNRFLAKYKKMGYTTIQPIYKSTSEKYAAEVEKMAITIAKNSTYRNRVQNKSAGSNKWIVYIAM